MISIYINIKEKIAPVKIDLYKEYNSFNKLRYLITSIDCPYCLKIAYKESKGDYNFIEVNRDSKISNTDNELLCQVMYELTTGNKISFKKEKELSTVI